MYPFPTCASNFSLKWACRHFTIVHNPKKEKNLSLFSCKFRGAVNFLSKLAEKLKDGTLPCVTTHSSGNFAQALALASSLLNFKAYVVMPSTAPQCKQDAVKEYGAELVLCTPTEQVGFV